MARGSRPGGVATVKGVDAEISQGLGELCHQASTKRPFDIDH